MGLTKNYLRFVHDSTLGVVAASRAGSSIKFLQIRDTRDRYVAVPANESIYIWDTKTRQVANKFHYDADTAAEVSALAYYPKLNLLAAGYANGNIRVFDVETGGLRVTFTGHRTAITALVFDNRDGSRLASGSKDCNIVVWDIIAEKGLFSLKGHKGSISKLAFLYNEEFQRDCLVSSSTDAVSTIKFWDLQVQHCFHTTPGQANGVWSFAIYKNGTRLVTGSASPELKVYSISFTPEIEVNHLGNILRNSTTTSKRVEDIVLDEAESMMVCHSVDKNIELYMLRSPEEALTYAKKKAKKAARKDGKRKSVDDDEVEPRKVSLETLDPQETIDCEVNRKLGCTKLEHKVKALAITESTRKDGMKLYKLVVESSSNRIDSFVLDPSAATTNKELLRPLGSIESSSHRTDVRSIAFSSDGSLIASASAECLKIWRLESRSCVSTIDTEYGTCCMFANPIDFGANLENRFCLLATKQGNIQIIDTAQVKVIETMEVVKEGKPLNALCILPDRSGFVCGGDDGVVRFFKFSCRTTDEDGQKQISLTAHQERELLFQEAITCIKVSSNMKFLAVAILDSTVRVHFMDTFKYFLTMYGHKFPVTTMDISDDNTLLVTGSADKNIKIWGLDFGDCHKSIFAHDDVVTFVQFVPKTHYIFSVGRDKLIKQWDCDHFIKIQTLRSHHAEIWCLNLNSSGKYLVTGSHDKSIRIFRRTEEILIPSEEEETERELEDERNVFEKQDNIIIGESKAEIDLATKMTIETVKSTDRLIEAIDVFGNEQEKEREYNKLCLEAEKSGQPKPPEPEKDPLLMTMMTTDYKRYMLEVLRRIKSSELEQILITLPFDYVRRLLIILVLFLDRNWEVELMVRCAVFLLKVNFGQVGACSALVPVLSKLKTIIVEKCTQLRDNAGFNLIALDHLQEDREYQSTRVSRDIPVKFY